MKHDNSMAVNKVGVPPVIILATRILKHQLPKEEDQIRQIMKQRESKQGSKRIMRKVTFLITQKNPNPC
ncbi:hypothetical protein Hanom_Chr03g00256131 [Helianthus anomalus]